MMRSVFRLTVAALSLGLALLTSAGAKDWKQVRIATEGARPPYNFLDQNNEVAGFEIDLAKDLCARMEVSCEFSTQDWDSLVPGLQAGRYDAVMAAMEITEERKQTMLFSEPYVRMPLAFAAARKRAIRQATPQALKDHTIGVEADSNHQSYLESIYAESEIKTYGSLEEAFLDMGEGRVDSVFGDKDAVMDFLEHRREAQCCKFLAEIPRDPSFFGEGIGIAMRKSDQDLKAMFDKALAASIADGSFMRIRAKYWDYSIR